MAGNENAAVDRDNRARRRGRGLAVAAVIVLIGLLAALPLQVCRDWGFVCENTGSHKGYRQWCTGHRTGLWHNESRLEQFMRQNHASALVRQWVSYTGTGRNIFGRAILFGHGRPNSTLMMYRAAFDRYVDGLDDAGKLSLYRSLASGQQDEIEVHMKNIQENWLASAGRASPPD